MSTLWAPLERTTPWYEGYLGALRDDVRARRAALEAIPRDADIDYGHEEGQIMSLLWMEQVLSGLLEGTGSA